MTRRADGSRRVDLGGSKFQTPGRCKVSYAMPLRTKTRTRGAALTCLVHLDRRRYEPFVLTPSLGRRDLTSDTTSLPFTAVDFV